MSRIFLCAFCAPRASFPRWLGYVLEFLGEYLVAGIEGRVHKGLSFGRYPIAMAVRDLGDQTTVL